MATRTRSNGNSKPLVTNPEDEFSDSRNLIISSIPPSTEEEDIQGFLDKFKASNINIHESSSKAVVTLSNPKQLDEAVKTLNDTQLKETEVVVRTAPNECLLCVAHIPLAYTEEQFRELCEKYGTVEFSCVLRCQAKDESKGYGLVRYSGDVEQMNKIKSQFDWTQLENQALHVDNLADSCQTWDDLRSKCLLVSGMAEDFVDVSRLREIFGCVTSPVYCQIISKGDKSLGYGIVEYRSAEDAEQTWLKLHNTKIQGRNTFLSFCIPGKSAVTINSRIMWKFGDKLQKASSLLPDPVTAKPVIAGNPIVISLTNSNPRLMDDFTVVLGELQQAYVSQMMSPLNKPGLLGPAPSLPLSPMMNPNMQLGLVVMLALNMQRVKREQFSGVLAKQLNTLIEQDADMRPGSKPSILGDPMTGQANVILTSLQKQLNQVPLTGDSGKPLPEPQSLVDRLGYITKKFVSNGRFLNLSLLSNLGQLLVTMKQTDNSPQGLGINSGPANKGQSLLGPVPMQPPLMNTPGGMPNMNKGGTSLLGEAPGMGPGMGPGIGPGMGPGIGPGMGPGIGPTMNKGMGMGPGLPGPGPGMKPGLVGSKPPLLGNNNQSGSSPLATAVGQSLLSHISQGLVNQIGQNLLNQMGSNNNGSQQPQTGGNAPPMGNSGPNGGRGLLGDGSRGLLGDGGRGLLGEGGRGLLGDVPNAPPPNMGVSRMRPPNNKPTSLLGNPPGPPPPPALPLPQPGKTSLLGKPPGPLVPQTPTGMRGGRQSQRGIEQPHWKSGDNSFRKQTEMGIDNQGGKNRWGNGSFETGFSNKGNMGAAGFKDFGFGSGDSVLDQNSAERNFAGAFGDGSDFYGNFQQFGQGFGMRGSGAMGGMMAGASSSGGRFNPGNQASGVGFQDGPMYGKGGPGLDQDNRKFASNDFGGSGLGAGLLEGMGSGLRSSMRNNNMGGDDLLDRAMGGSGMMRGMGLESRGALSGSLGSLGSDGDIRERMGGSMRQGLGASMGSSLGGNMGNGLSGNMGSSLGGNMGSGLGGNMGSGLGRNMGSGLGRNMGSGLGENMGSGLGGNIGSGLGGNMGSGLGRNMVSGLGGNIGSGLGGNMGSGLSGNVGSGLDRNRGNGLSAMGSRLGSDMDNVFTSGLGSGMGSDSFSRGMASEIGRTGIGLRGNDMASIMGGNLDSGMGLGFGGKEDLGFGMGKVEMGNVFEPFGSVSGSGGGSMVDSIRESLLGRGGMSGDMSGSGMGYSNMLGGRSMTGRDSLGGEDMMTSRMGSDSFSARSYSGGMGGSSSSGSGLTPGGGVGGGRASLLDSPGFGTPTRGGGSSGGSGSFGGSLSSGSGMMAGRDVTSSLYGRSVGGMGASGLLPSPPKYSNTPAGQKRSHSQLLPMPEPSPDQYDYIGQHSQGIGGHYMDSYKRSRLF